MIRHSSMPKAVSVNETSRPSSPATYADTSMPTEPTASGITGTTTCFAENATLISQAAITIASDSRPTKASLRVSSAAMPTAILKTEPGG